MLWRKVNGLLLFYAGSYVGLIKDNRSLSLVALAYLLVVEGGELVIYI